jgi:hypothetical protein
MEFTTCVGHAIENSIAGKYQIIYKSFNTTSKKILIFSSNWIFDGMTNTCREFHVENKL